MLKLDINTVATDKKSELTQYANIGDEYYQLILNNLKNITEIAQSGIQDNLEKGKDIYGNPVYPLRPNTIKKKGHDRVFYEKGELLKSVLNQQLAMNEYQIYISGDRSQIMYYLNYGTNIMQPRLAFGLSTEADSKIQKYIDNLVKKNK